MSLVCWYHGSLVAWSNFGSLQPGNCHHVMGPSSTTTMTQFSACRRDFEACGCEHCNEQQPGAALCLCRGLLKQDHNIGMVAVKTPTFTEKCNRHTFEESQTCNAREIYIYTWFQYCCKWWSELLPPSPSSLPSTRWTQAALVPMPPSEPRVWKPDVFDMHKTGWDPSHWRFHVYLAWAYYTTHYASFWRKMHLAGGTGESFRCKWDGTVH